VRPTTWLGLAALGIVLLVLKAGFFDHHDVPWRWHRLRDGQFKGAAYPGDVVIAGRARLLGYDVRPQHAVSGDLVYVDLYWTLNEPLKFRASVRLLDERGLEWSAKDEIDTALIGNYSGPPPSNEWPLATYADDRHAIQILPGTPPGEYWLVVVPFKPSSLEPLPISAGQSPPGNYPGAIVGKLTLARAAQPPAAKALGLAVSTDVLLGTDLALIGHSQDRAEAIPGQSMLLVLGWQARRQPQADYALQLELIAPDGKAIPGVLPFSTSILRPGGDYYPTSRWAAGEVVRTQVLARVPGQAGSGQHTWRITLLDASGAPLGQTTLGQLQITAPERVFSAPPLSRWLNVKLGDWVMLAGADVPDHIQTGQSISVTLAWQALKETSQDYKTFVHLLNADGQLVAQSDAVPAGWTRPTSGWQSSEFVSDTHTLDLKRNLPPGEYRLIAGMYDSNGQRLLLESGGDAIELGKLEISAQ
jgi:hypothetical protein